MGEAIQLRRLSGEDCESGDSVLVTLDGFVLRHLFSTDGLDHIAGREGVLAFDVCGQVHDLSWSTDGAGRLARAARFHDVVLYAGEVHDGLQASVTLVEADAARFERFRLRSGHVLDAISAVSGTVPGYGPVVGASAGLLKALLGYAASESEDDVEMHYMGDLLAGDVACPMSGTGEEDVSVRLERLPGSGKGPADFSLDFRVRQLPSLSPREEIALYLQRVDFDLGSRAGGRHLVLEGTFGEGRGAGALSVLHRVPERVERLGATLALRRKLLYVGAWAGVLPFSISGALIKERDHLGLDGIVSAGSELHRELASLRGLDRSELRSSEDRYDGISSGAQSILSLALEFLGGRFSLGMISGILIRSDDASHQRRGTPCRRVCPGHAFEVVLGDGEFGEVVLHLVLEPR